MPICRRLFKQYVCLDFSFARDNAGRSMPARIAMMAITTSNSIRVKADFIFVFVWSLKVFSLWPRRASARLFLGTGWALVFDLDLGLDRIAVECNRAGSFFDLNPNGLPPLPRRAGVADLVVLEHDVLRLAANPNARHVALEAVVLDDVFFESISVAGHGRALVAKI